MMIKVILVDDEESGINVLRKLLLAYFPNILILAEYTNITDAETGLKKQHPDILFLDIQMPDGNGFELLENLGSVNFAVVFVTAYEQYAIKALKMSAADYLLKPINRTDLQFAIDKSLQLKPFYESNAINYAAILHNARKSNYDKVFVTNKYKGESIPFNAIICVEADTNYCIIHTTGQKRISIPKPLKEVEDILCDDTYSFIRIHKSVIINTSKISKYQSLRELDMIYLTEEFSFQVAKRKKTEIREILSKLSQELQ